MRRFVKLLAFELRLQCAGVTVWLTLGALALLGAQAVAGEPTQVNGVHLGLLHGGASTFLLTLSGLSIPGIVLAAIFIGTAVLRHQDARTHELVRSAPIGASVYLGAQFVAGFVLLLAAFLAVAGGMFAGLHSPILTPGSIGPLPWRALTIIFVVHLLPNLFFSASAVLLLLCLTRSLKYSVVGAMGIVVLHSVANAITRDKPSIAAIIDPFAGQAAIHALSLWDAARLNYDAPWDGTILSNRVLWLTISVAMLVVAFRGRWHGARTRMSVIGSASPPDDRTTVQNTAFHRVERGTRAELRKCMSLLVRSLRSHLSSLPFWLCLFALSIIVAVYIAYSRSVDGSPVYPLTHYVLRAILEASSPAYMLILGFIAGDLVHGERDHRITRLTDAFPISNAAVVISTLTSMVTVVIVLAIACAIVGITYQLADGGVDLEPGLYLAGLTYISLPMLIFGVAAVALQWLCVNKYTGYLSIAALAVVPRGLAMLGVQDHLLLFNTTSPVRYSDMGGFGPFAIPALWFNGYWLFLVTAAALAASCFRVRSDDDRAHRWNVGRRLLTRPEYAWPIGLMISCFIGSGAWIAWNTHFLNVFDDSSATAAAHARYEALYRRYAASPQPSLGKVDLQVDIRPGDREVRFEGKYTLINRTSRDISSLLVSWNPHTRVIWSASAGRLRLNDRVAGFSSFDLPRVLHPGDTMTLGFAVTYGHEGFTNDGGKSDVIRNGTFVTNALLPSVGYLGDAIADKSELIDFHAIVATQDDEIALAPGKHVRTWIDSGKRFDEFVSERKIINSYGFLSGRWVINRARYQNTYISVYAIAKHPWNIPTLLDAATDGLRTYGATYGPYQATELRIAEFPEYSVFAESFSGLIAFSGSLGFSSRGAAGDEVDFPYFVTAHELAHQWWGQALRPASQPGRSLLTEGMAQYSAVELMRQNRPAGVGRTLAFLRHQYLNAASDEIVEQSVAAVTDQTHVAYDKAPLALERYRDLVGEAEANATITHFFKENAGEDRPPVQAKTYVDALRESVRPSDQATFDLWFFGSGHVPAPEAR